MQSIIQQWNDIFGSGMLSRNCYSNTLPTAKNYKYLPLAYSQSSTFGQAVTVVIMQASSVLVSDWLYLLKLFWHLHIS